MIVLMSTNVKLMTMTAIKFVLISSDHSTAHAMTVTSLKMMESRVLTSMNVMVKMTATKMPFAITSKAGITVHVLMAMVAMVLNAPMSTNVLVIMNATKMQFVIILLVLITVPVPTVTPVMDSAVKMITNVNSKNLFAMRMPLVITSLVVSIALVMMDMKVMALTYVLMSMNAKLVITTVIQILVCVII